MDIVLVLCVGLVALLYSAVGHGGSSGYIATMVLFGLAPTEYKPLALALNILVSAVAFAQYARQGHFRWALFWPFAVTSVPMAYVGAQLQLPDHVLKLALAVVLLCSALYFAWKPSESPQYKPLNVLAALAIGAGIGLLAGITSTGGGIFLTPLLLMLAWGPTKQVSAVSALFVFVNSLSGLWKHFAEHKPFPDIVVPLLLVVLVAGALGSAYGSRYAQPQAIKRLLAAVLLIAAWKLTFA